MNGGANFYSVLFCTIHVFIIHRRGGNVTAVVNLIDDRAWFASSGMEIQTEIYRGGVDGKLRRLP
jgi:hypothetical protein